MSCVRRLMIIGLASLLAIGCLVAPVAAKTSQVLVGAAQVPVETMDSNGTLMIPLRQLSDAVGAQITWNPRLNAAVITNNGRTVQYPFGADYILVDGRTIKLKAPIVVLEGRAYAPLLEATQYLGVTIAGANEADASDPANGATSLFGAPVAPVEQARAWLARRAPGWEVMADIYYSIAQKYGLRPDIALAQACKETGFFQYGGIVKPYQNNFAGMAASGQVATGNEKLDGVDSSRVWYTAGVHGMIFATKEDGVEAHIQHLYAYATGAPLPEGTVLVDPRFYLVRRGTAPYAEYLGAKENPTGVGWAYPGYDYGHDLVASYMKSLLNTPYEPAPVVAPVEGEPGTETTAPVAPEETGIGTTDATGTGEKEGEAAEPVTAGAAGESTPSNSGE
jgi:hypothetical protein